MPIVWAVMTMIQLRFAKDIDILGGRALKCTAQPSGESQSFPYAKILSDTSELW